MSPVLDYNYKIFNFEELCSKIKRALLTFFEYFYNTITDFKKKFFSNKGNDCNDYNTDVRFLLKQT